MSLSGRDTREVYNTQGSPGLLQVETYQQGTNLQLAQHVGTGSILLFLISLLQLISIAALQCFIKFFICDFKTPLMPYLVQPNSSPCAFKYVAASAQKSKIQYVPGKCAYQRWPRLSPPSPFLFPCPASLPAKACTENTFQWNLEYERRVSIASKVARHKKAIFN